MAKTKRGRLAKEDIQWLREAFKKNPKATPESLVKRRKSLEGRSPETLLKYMRGEMPTKRNAASKAKGGSRWMKRQSEVQSLKAELEEKEATLLRVLGDELAEANFNREAMEATGADPWTIVDALVLMIRDYRKASTLKREQGEAA